MKSMGAKTENLFCREIEINLPFTETQDLSRKNNVTLKIYQNYTGTVATVVWDSALVATKYFEKCNLREPGIFNGKRILELGAGTGVCGLTLSALGASVDITDLESELDLIQTNIEANIDCFALKPQCLPLDWTNQDSVAEFCKKNYDMIILIDCLYYEASLQPLVTALKALSTEKTDIFCAYEKRDIGKPQIVQQQFFQLAEEHFSVLQYAEESLDQEYSSPDIPVFQLMKKM